MNAQREIDRLQEENRHLRADLADAKGAAAGAREDAERFRAERDALRVERCARDRERETACDLTACDLGRILLWAASVAIERDELRAKEDMRALSALAFPPEPGTLTRAEADELRRQGEG